VKRETTSAIAFEEEEIGTQEEAKTT